MKTQPSYPRILCFAFFIISSFTAQGIEYTAVTNGDWNAATTWSPSGIPSPTDDVVIPFGISVTLNDTRSIRKIQMSRSWLDGTGTLILTGSFPNFSRMDTAAVFGSVSIELNASKLELNGAALFGTSTLNVPYGSELIMQTDTATLIANNAKIMIDEGGLFSIWGSRLKMRDNGHLICLGQMDIHNYYNIPNILAQEAPYSGIGIQVQSGGTLRSVFGINECNVPLATNGVFQIEENQFWIFSTWTNSGTINNYAEIVLDGTQSRALQNGSTYVASPFSSLTKFTQNNGTTTLPSTQFIMPGEIYLKDGTLTGTSILSSPDVFYWDGGTLDVATDFTGDVILRTGLHTMTNKVHDWDAWVVWAEGDLDMQRGSALSLGYVMQVCNNNTYQINAFGTGTTPTIYINGSLEHACSSIKPQPNRVESRAPSGALNFNNVAVTFGPVANLYGPFNLNFTQSPTGFGGRIESNTGTPDEWLITAANFPPFSLPAFALLDDSGPGIGNDVITISGNMQLAGTLVVTLADPMNPPAPASHVLFRCNGGANCLSGTFSTTNLPSGYFVQYTGAEVRVVSTALPVDLISFSGEVFVSENLLKWKTASEFNSKVFQIERSVDARNYVAIGEKPAAGNSTEVHSYTFSDVKPLQQAYYRLKEIDHSGRESTSDVIFLSRMDASTNWTVTPNPTSAARQVTLKTDNNLLQEVERVTLFDIIGKQIMSFQPAMELNNGVQQFSLPTNLAAGYYQIVLSGAAFTQEIPLIVR